MKRKITVLILMLLISVTAAGCTRLKSPKSTASAEDDSIDVYYLEADRLTMTARSYTAKSESFDGILNELLDVYVSPEAAGVFSALPDNVAINGYSMGVDNLTVDFNAAYLGLTNIQKALLEASIVKTLVQLPGVLNISITVDGQQVRDEEGNTLTFLNDDSFLESQGEGLASYRFAPIKLYFASSDGNMLAAESRGVSYSSNMMTEQAAAEEIILGPDSMQLKAVVSPQTRINNVEISRGICHLDMNDAFNRQEDGSISAETCIYAFVNTICELGNVYGVQFTVNGHSDVRFWGQVPLDQTFHSENSLIEGAQAEEQSE